VFVAGCGDRDRAWHADKIGGGVFVVSGATVERVVNAGTVTTQGKNDMVLDNWGYVKHWEAVAAITSIGPSGNRIASGS
jgi:hypothetical protein